MPKAYIDEQQTENDSFLLNSVILWDKGIGLKEYSF